MRITNMRSFFFRFTSSNSCCIFILSFKIILSRNKFYIFFDKLSCFFSFSIKKFRMSISYFFFKFSISVNKTIRDNFTIIICNYCTSCISFTKNSLEKIFFSTIKSVIYSLLFSKLNFVVFKIKKFRSFLFFTTCCKKS